MVQDSIIRCQKGRRCTIGGTADPRPWTRVDWEGGLLPGCVPLFEVDIIIITISVLCFGNILYYVKT